jgi:hypothetical protein
VDIRGFVVIYIEDTGTGSLTKETRRVRTGSYGALSGEGCDGMEDGRPRFRT